MDRNVGNTIMTQQYNVYGDGNTPSLNLPTRTVIISQPSSTSISLAVGIEATIKYTIQRINPTTKANIGSPVTVVIDLGDEQVIEDLVEGATYSISIQAQNGTSTGNTQTLPPYTMSQSYAGNGLGITNLPPTPQQLKTAKSYLELAYLGTNKKQFAIAYKSFNGVTLPTSTQASSTLPNSQKSLARSYTPAYYSFGTSLFMDNNESYPNQSAGIGLFVKDYGKSGYFVLVETTASSASQDRKSVRIVKATPSGMVELTNTQRSAGTTFDGVFGGKAYFVDIKVKVVAQTVTINAYINGFKITAIDTNNFSNSKNLNFIVPPTQNVGLIVTKGKATFDYVYATSIEQNDYASAEYNPNFYQGQFSDDLLETAYGNLFYNSNYNESEDAKKKVVIEEFGSVVREIVRVQPKFNARPAFPVKWSTGGNKYAKLIGQKISSFGGEAYVLNNTSTTIPLSDGAGAALYVFGNDIAQSGTLEYSTDDEEEYNYKEPIIFQSSWIQNESDAKALAEWIKNKVVNRGRVVNMKVFGNPLISVGDIVGVKYTYQGFTGIEKLIITSVSHSYNQGLETDITCRTL